MPTITHKLKQERIIQNKQDISLIKHIPQNKKTLDKASVLNGAEDEIRTRDIRLGKATLYH